MNHLYTQKISLHSKSSAYVGFFLRLF